MKEFTLKFDDAPDIQFIGELLSRVSSKKEWHTDPDRWTELEVYKTASGKFICRVIGHTTHRDEDKRDKVKVVTNTNEISEFFGDSWLAKKLYKNIPEMNRVFID